MRGSCPHTHPIFLRSPLATEIRGRSLLTDSALLIVAAARAVGTCLHSAQANCELQQRRWKQSSSRLGHTSPGRKAAKCKCSTSKNVVRRQWDKKGTMIYVTCRSGEKKTKKKTAHLSLVVFQEKLGYRHLQQGIIMAAIVCEATGRAEEMGGCLIKG